LFAKKSLRNHIVKTVDTTVILSIMHPPQHCPSCILLNKFNHMLCTSGKC
jgi:hypothetical protein